MVGLVFEMAELHWEASDYVQCLSGVTATLTRYWKPRAARFSGGGAETNTAGAGAPLFSLLCRRTFEQPRTLSGSSCSVLCHEGTVFLE